MVRVLPSAALPLAQPGLAPHVLLDRLQEAAMRHGMCDGVHTYARGAVSCACLLAAASVCPYLDVMSLGRVGVITLYLTPFTCQNQLTSNTIKLFQKYCVESYIKVCFKHALLVLLLQLVNSR